MTDFFNYVIENVHTYTGSWFCYTSKALTLIGNANCSGHTFIIAIMKYVMIVLHEKMRFIEKEKAQRIFCNWSSIWTSCLFSSDPYVLAPLSSTPHASLSVLMASMPLHWVGAEPLEGRRIPFACGTVYHPRMLGIKKNVFTLSGPFAVGAS